MWVGEQQQNPLPATGVFSDQPLGGESQRSVLVVEAINGSIRQKITQDCRSAGFDGVVLVGERVGGLEMD